MATGKRIRRNQQQWQTIIHDWQQSGQSAIKYCEALGISYGSFCQWRRRLGRTSEDQTTPQFIDLAALSGSSDQGWHIVLKLGEGIELSFRR